MIYLPILHIQNYYDKIYIQKTNGVPNFEIFKRERGWILLNKKLYIFFSLTSFAYMLSVSVYLLNSFILLNDTIFAVTRILMICCLLIFLLFGLKLKTIAKIEGNNQTLTKFQHIQKVWSIVIITAPIIFIQNL